MDAKRWQRERDAMVATVAAHARALPEGPCTLSARVLEAMRTLPRHRFVPEGRQAQAHGDHPLPVGCGKTISQPFIVALMTDLLDPQPQHRVLELGTGSGYQTALLARLAGEVCSVERLAPLSAQAGERLAALGVTNVRLRVGNGFDGWPEHAPFDRILITGAPEQLPQALPAQLRAGGRIVAPLGPAGLQQLSVIDKDAEGRLHTREWLPVVFSALEDRRPGMG